MKYFARKLLGCIMAKDRKTQSENRVTLRSLFSKWKMEFFKRQAGMTVTSLLMVPYSYHCLKEDPKII